MLGAVLERGYGGVRGGRAGRGAGVRAIAMGVHVLDVLARPVDAIPEGQGGQLVDEIRVTAAGSAGGTALVLAKLGAEVRSAGAVGDDVLGEMLVFLLRRAGVDPSLLVRASDVQTSASVLPIRPNGDRPAFHVIGANGTYGAADAPLDEIAEATHLHLGGPEFMGGEDAAKVLAHARANGVTTSADMLAPGEPGLLEWIAPALPELDYLLPNDEQVLGFTGATDLEDGLPRACWSAAWAAWPRPVAPRARWWWTRTERWPCPPSRWTWWTPPAAATPSRPASCAASISAATARRRPGWAAPPRRLWPRAWAPTTAASRSPTCRRCALRRMK